MEPARSDRRIPVARFSFEGVLIIVSILAAFAIDSWWSARQLAAEEQELLLQLKSEFEINFALLLETRGRHESTLETSNALLEITGPNTTNKEIENENVERDLANMLRWRTFDPQMGVLTGMIQSGKLGIIRADRLRSALASWPARVQDLAEDENYAKNFTVQVVLPYLVESTSIRMIDFGAKYARFEPSEFSGDFERLLTDRAFENLVVTKHNMTTTALAEYDNLRAFIDEILQLIDEEIDTG